MPRRAIRSDAKNDTMERIVVPGGAPTWVTAELIAHTLRVWQPYYAERLTPEDALAMIQAAGSLIEVLSTGDK